MSMIELVFAIVIMGISVMSLPLVLTQVQNNDAFTMRQEAILAAKEAIGDILTYQWDEHSYDSTAGRSFVLDTTHADPELSRDGNTTQRVGHVNANYRRKLFDTSVLFANRSASAIGADGGNLDDIDDFDGQVSNVNLSAEAAGTGLDYVLSVNLKSDITYATDTGTYSNQTLNDFVFNPVAQAATTNIKAITVTVRDANDANKTITSLCAFTCNIGESTFIPSRPYQ